MTCRRMSSSECSSIIPLLNVQGVLKAFSVYTKPSKKELLLDDGCHALTIHIDGSVHIGSPLASTDTTVYPVANHTDSFFSFSRQTGLLRYNDKDFVLASSDPLLGASAMSLPIKLISQYVTDQALIRKMREGRVERVHVIVGHTHASLFTAIVAKQDTRMTTVQRFSDFDRRLTKVVPLLHESQGKTDLRLLALFETGELCLYNIDLSMPEIRDITLIDKLNVEGVKDIYCNPFTSEVFLRSMSDILYYLPLRDPYTHVELTRLHPDENVIMDQVRTSIETTFFISRSRDKGLQTQVQWQSFSHSTSTCVTTAEVIYPKVLLRLYPLDTQVSTQFYDASCLAVDESGDIDLLFASLPSVPSKGLASKIASLSKEVTSTERELSHMRTRSKAKYASPATSPRGTAWMSTSLTSLELDIKKHFNQTHNIQMITLSLKSVCRMILIQIPSSLKLADAVGGLSTDLGLLMFLNTSKCEFSVARSQDYLPFKQLALSVAFFPSGSDASSEVSPVYFDSLLLDEFEQEISLSTTSIDISVPRAVYASVPCTAVANTRLCNNTEEGVKLYLADKLTLEAHSVQGGNLELSGDSPHLIIQTIASVTGQQYSPALLKNNDYCTSLRLEETILHSVRLKSLAGLIESMDYYSYISLLRDLKLGTEPALAQYSNFLLMSPKGINAVHVALVGASTRLKESTELALACASTGTSTIL